MDSIKANIVLHFNQQKIKDFVARFKVIKAGKRFGKTKLAAYVCIGEAAGRRGATIWYVAPTYRMAKQIAWRELLNICPPHLIRRKVESELTLELVSGSTIYLLGADNEDSLRGPAIDVLIMDEAAYMKETVWTNILSGQLIRPDRKSMAYFISSPNSRGRNWFTEFHKQAEARYLNGDKDWKSFYFTIYDNPTLPKEEIDRQKQIVSDETWNLEYLALESDYAGPLISEFKFETHVGVWKDYTPDLKVRGLDWGIDHPTVCLFVSCDTARKTVSVDNEFVKSGYLIHESCKSIKDLTGSVPVDWSVIDPSTAKRNSQTGRSDKDEFMRYGIYCIPGDNKFRGYDIMKMFFKTDRIRINPLCRNLINEIRNYHVGDKEGDDCLDALRYVLVRLHDYVMGGSNVFLSNSNPMLVKNEYSLLNKRQFKEVGSENSDHRFSYLYEAVD